MTKWFVVGIGGATCSGKTTVAEKLHEKLKNSVLINQDRYFLAENDPRHVRVPELNHNNYDIETSLDMKEMHKDILKVLESENGMSENSTTGHKQTDTRVLILDGFLLFNCIPIANLCDCRYFLTLTRDQCFERRKLRIYDPPDVPGYFELIVWPEYEKNKRKLEKCGMLNDKIIYIDGMIPKEETLERIHSEILNKLSNNHY